jgi:hypothetical protein
MSIPLDRLYNFLDSISNHNLLIYRWNPHGSRNLNNLTMLKSYDKSDLWPNIPAMICHDQEPLDYNYYSESDIINFIKNSCPFTTNSPEFEIYMETSSKTAKEFMLRTIGPPSVYDRTLILHSEKNSNEVLKYQSNELVPVYLWSHAIIARDWFRYAEIDPLLKNKSITKDFLVYNRAWSGVREYRLRFTELIVNYDLAEKCKMSFSDTDQNYHYQSHQFKNPTLSISRFDLEDFFENNLTPSSASADYAGEDYQTCGIEIVLETLFDDTRWHLTEKILRPIACGQPFILVSTPGSLAYLQSYGFQTFENIIDEDYDNIQDPAQRLVAIVDLMKSIATMPGAQKEIMYKKMQEVCEHNHKRFFSKEFQQQVILEYQQNLNQGITEMNNYTTGIKFQYLESKYHPQWRPSWATLAQYERTKELLKHSNVKS